MRDLPDGCVRLWWVPGYRSMLDIWTTEEQPVGVEEDEARAYLAMPSADFHAMLDKAGRVDALVAGLRDAENARDLAADELGRALKDNDRLQAEVAALKWVLGEARDSVERDYLGCDEGLQEPFRQALLARIDTLLGGK